MWSTPSLTLLPNPLRLGVVIPVRVPCVDKIELFYNLQKSISYLKPYCFVQRGFGIELPIELMCPKT